MSHRPSTMVSAPPDTEGLSENGGTEPRFPLRRVCLLTVSLDNIGPARALAWLAAGLDRRQFDVQVCCFERAADGPVHRLLASAGIPLTVLRVRGWFDLRALPRLVAFLRRERIDILHTRLRRADFYGRLAGRLAGVPALVCNVVDLHSRHFVHQHGRFIGSCLLRLERALLPMATRIVTNSRGVAEDLARHTGLAEETLVTIPNGIDAAEYAVTAGTRASWRQRYGFGSDQLVIGTVGRLVALKQVDRLIRAAPEICARESRARFLIVGDGPEREALTALARRLGVSGQVVWTGAVPDVVGALATMDIFALLSTAEGLPNAVLEAMASSLPVVATNVAGTNEVVKPRVTGLLVDPDDTDALVAAICELCRDGERRVSLGRAARERVLQEFSIDRMVARFQHLYASLPAATPS